MGAARKQRWQQLEGPLNSQQPPLMTTMALLVLLCYALPLALTSYVPGSSPLLVLSPLSSPSPTPLLFYLLLPTLLLLSLLQCLRIKYCGWRQCQKDNSILSPSEFACLLTLPAPQLAEDWLASQIEDWWNAQLTNHPEKTANIIPQNYNDGLLSSRSGRVIVQAFLWSHDCQQLVEAGKRLGKEEEEGLQWLGELGNQERNRLLQSSRLKYCIVIFGSIGLSQLFFRAHNQCACNETAAISFEGVPLKVERGVLPNQVHWEKMHLQRRTLSGWVLAVLATIIGAGAWVGGCCLHRGLLERGSDWGPRLPWLAGAVANLYVLCWQKGLSQWGKSQATTSWKQEQQQWVNRCCLISVATLGVCPFGAYWLAGSWLFWQEGGAMETLLCSSGFYMVLALLTPLLNQSVVGYWFGCSLEKPEADIPQQFGQSISVLYLSFLLTPLQPLLGVVTLGWSLLCLLRESLLGRCLYSPGPPHGLQFIVSPGPLLELVPLILVISSSLTWMLVSVNLGGSLSVGEAVTLGLVVILGVATPFLSKQICWNTSNKKYSELSSQYLMLYEETNPIYLTSKQHSGRLKVEEQLQTMSKTLALSLKEQLLNRQNTPVGPHIQETEEDQVDALYFTYEQRVFMKPRENRVAVPPLFPKPESTAGEEQEGTGRRCWLDKEGRRQLKEYMKSIINQSRIFEP